MIRPRLTTVGCWLTVVGMDLDTALLRTWCVLAEEQHTGRAAQRLQISQQAVSKRLARLEQQLGTVLFERDGRRLRPTRVGIELLPQAAELVADVDRLVTRARPEQRELRIDVLDQQLSIAGAAADHASRSRLSISLVTRGDTRTAREVLRSGYADLAFGRASSFTEGAPAPIALAGPVLEPIVLLVGDGHPLAGDDEVDFEALRGLRLWFPMTGAPREWRGLVEDLAERCGLLLDPVGSTMGLPRFFDRLAASDDRISLYGAGMAAPPPGLRTVAISRPVPVFCWLAGWPATSGDRVPRRLAEAVIGRARRAIAEPDPEDAWWPDADRQVVESLVPARSRLPG